MGGEGVLWDVEEGLSGSKRKEMGVGFEWGVVYVGGECGMKME